MEPFARRDRRTVFSGIGNGRPSRCHAGDGSPVFAGVRRNDGDTDEGPWILSSCSQPGIDPLQFPPGW